MPINVQTLIPLFASITYGIVVGVVLSSKPLTNLRRVFIVYLSAMFLWSVSAFIILAELGNALIWFRVLVAVAIISMISLFYFVQTLFAQRRPWTPLVFWYGLISFCLSLFTSLVVKDAYVDGGYLVYEYNPMILFVAGPGYTLNIFSIIEIIKGYRSTDSEIQRTRFRYLITAISLILLISVVNWTELGKYPIDIAVNGIAALLIAFAILRHSLLDIRIFFRKGLLYSIFSAITGALYFLVITLALAVFETVSGEHFIEISVLVALVTSLLLSPLREKTQQWIDRIFYRVKYDSGLMLQRLSETTAALMDVEDITDLILQEIIETMKLEHASFFIKYERGDVYQLVSHKGSSNGAFYEFRADHPIVKWLSDGEYVLTKNQLYIDPVFKSLWSSERYSIGQNKIEIFISLIAGRELVGFFTVGAKRSSQPFTQEEQRILTTVANQTAVAIKNARLFNELQETFVQTVVTLANAIDIRDTYTSDHSQRIAGLAIETAKAMGCDYDTIQRIYWGSLLHDIGKIGIPDAILLKSGPLDDEEWAIIKSHPDIGANLIQPIRQLTDISPIIKHSHEWYNGRGYPSGLREGAIPLGARIVAVVDAFSAMMDKRVYKEANTLEETIEELHRFSGTQFDPEVVDAFLQVLKSDRHYNFAAVSRPASLQ